MKTSIIVLTIAAMACIVPVAVHAQAAKDLNGVWLRQGGGGGENPVSQWSAKSLPFTPAGLERFNNNKPGKGPRGVPPAFGNDPLGEANPPGLYRALVYGRPFELIQLPDKIVQIFEWTKVWRVIWTDGREVPEDVAAGPYWYGYSVGRWEGDTLVVETIGLDSRAWLDEWGTPLSDTARVQERWRRVDAQTLELTLRIDDPETYTEAWVSDPRTFQLQPKDSPNGELLEVIFAPMDEKEFNARIRNPAAGVPAP